MLILAHLFLKGGFRSARQSSEPRFILYKNKTMLILAHLFLKGGFRFKLGVDVLFSVSVCDFYVSFSAGDGRRLCMVLP